MQIFIAESNDDLRVGLQMMLHRDASMHVIGITAQAKGLLAQLEALEPEVLILDWHLSGASMPELVDAIRQLESSPKIVVLSVKAAEEGRALGAGADLFVTKRMPPEKLLDALNSLKEGTKDSSN